MPKPISLPFAGSQLRELRERQGLTQTVLAELCARHGRRVHPQQISRLEAGTDRPTPATFRALYLALDVSPDALLDGAEPDAAAVGQ
jgi:transcriptional regulator with XRE-family HTH domain